MATMCEFKSLLYTWVMIKMRSVSLPPEYHLNPLIENANTFHQVMDKLEKTDIYCVESMCNLIDILHTLSNISNSHDDLDDFSNEDRLAIYIMYIDSPLKLSALGAMSKELLVSYWTKVNNFHSEHYNEVENSGLPMVKSNSHAVLISSSRITAIDLNRIRRSNSSSSSSPSHHNTSPVLTPRTMRMRIKSGYASIRLPKNPF